MLSGAIFGGIAMLRGPVWNLQPQEKQSIGTAIADCLAALPEQHAEKASDVMSTFAAPVALISAIGAAVMPRIIYDQQYAAQLNAEAARKKEVENVPTPQPTARTADPKAASPLAVDPQLRAVAADGRASTPGPVA